MWVAPGRALDIVWRDMLFILLMVFLMLAILVNPPEDAKAIDSPGVLVVEIRWPDGLKIDVDLWVKAPGEEPVGFYNRAGRVFNLLRDDLGSARDDTPHNYEYSFARSIPDGEYIVTVHLYNNWSYDQFPLPVQARISILAPAGGTPTEILKRTVYLLSRGHEETVARFTLEGGELVPGSMSQIPAPLSPQTRRQ